MLNRIRSLFKRSRAHGVKAERSESAASSVAPAVFIVCGAGVAFWWWSQWVRSREENRGATSTSTPEPAALAEPPGSDDGPDGAQALQADATTPAAMAEPSMPRTPGTLAA